MKSNLYTNKIFDEGIRYLGITDINEQCRILFEMTFIPRELGAREIRDPYRVPMGLTKKEYNVLLKDTQNKIDRAKENIKNTDFNTIARAYWEESLQEWIEKKGKIKNAIKFLTVEKPVENLNIQKAKAYPIDQLMDFGGGFAKCLWHEQLEHRSLHYDKKRNKCHCFSCGVDKDSIDVCMKLYNLTFIEATKKLSI